MNLLIKVNFYRYIIIFNNNSKWLIELHSELFFNIKLKSKLIYTHRRTAIMLSEEQRILMVQSMSSTLLFLLLLFFIRKCLFYFIPKLLFWWCHRFLLFYTRPNKWNMHAHLCVQYVHTILSDGAVIKVDMYRLLLFKLIGDTSLFIRRETSNDKQHTVSVWPGEPYGRVRVTSVIHF